MKSLIGEGVEKIDKRIQIEAQKEQMGFLIA